MRILASVREQLSNYIMPDIVRCGGISEMRKIATMDEANHILVSPMTPPDR